MRPRNALLTACPWLSRDEASETLRSVDGDVERAKTAAAAARRQQEQQRPPQHDRDRASSSSSTGATGHGGEKIGDANVGKAVTSSLPPVARAPPRHAAPINNLSDRQYCCVWSVEVYDDGYRPDVARTLLASVARHVNPVLRSRGWRVKRLIESSSSQWIGLCTANGRGDADAASTNIQLNLRALPDRRCEEYRSFREVLAVMLHEITHTSIGLEDIHPPAFYELLDEIKAEYRTKLAAGEVDLETDDYGCDSNFVSSSGELTSVSASASDILAPKGAFNDMYLLGSLGSEGGCGVSKRRRRGGGGSRGRRGGNYRAGYTSNLQKEKKRPLLKGSKMVDKRTKVGKAAMAERDGVSARELAARAALVRFSNAASTGAFDILPLELEREDKVNSFKNHGAIDVLSSHSEGEDDDDDDSTDESIEEHSYECGCRSCEWSKLFDSKVCSEARS
jgi:hypothetical protein